MVPDGYSRPRHMSGGDPLAGRSLCGRARQWGGRSGAPQRGTEPSGTTQPSRLPVEMRVTTEMPDQVGHDGVIRAGHDAFENRE